MTRSAAIAQTRKEPFVADLPTFQGDLESIDCAAARKAEDMRACGIVAGRHHQTIGLHGAQRVARRIAAGNHDPMKIVPLDEAKCHPRERRTDAA